MGLELSQDYSFRPLSSIVLNRPQSSPIVLNRPRSSPIVLNRPQSSSIIPILVVTSNRQHMANAPEIHPGCDCAAHQNDYQDWPRENAEIRISSCMRNCPYCGKRHSNASRLRKHLRQRKYRERNIFIAAERPGAVGVGYFPYSLYSSGRSSYNVHPGSQTISAIIRRITVRSRRQRPSRLYPRKT